MTDEKFQKIDRVLEDGIHAIFEDIEYHRILAHVKPSEVMRHLETHWDLGDYWQEWWIESGEEWS